MSVILFYLKSIIIEFIPFIPFIFIFRAIAIFISLKKGNKFNLLREISIFLFLFFCFGLFSQTISFDFILKGDFTIKGGQNFVLLKGISQILNSKYKVHIVINILGNIMIFFPIGFLTPMIWIKFQKVIKTVFLGFSISFFIEFMQLFSIRSTDIDDLILNTLGTLLGYLFYIIFNFLRNKKIEVKEEYNNLTYFMKYYLNFNTSFSDLEMIADKCILKENEEYINGLKHEINQLYKLNNVRKAKKIFIQCGKRNFNSKNIEKMIIILCKKFQI